MEKYALGLVVTGHGRRFGVELASGEVLHCHTRGKKSDCVVGDRVRWAPSGDAGVIESIEPRRNLLFRQDDWKTKAFAANLDQVLIMVASEPVFSESQLARALVAAEQAGLAVVIVLNKTDLPATAAALERLAPYSAMGYTVLPVSIKTDTEAALARLQPHLQGRRSLVLGPSGTGKSTLINALLPQAQAAVGEISQALNSGRHTTTATRWYWLDTARETALLDSPGFQEFGLRHLDAQELPRWMPDIAAYTPDCRFYNCSHQHEPGCGVLAAAERGEIAPSRLRIYGEILSELQRTRW